MRPGVLESTRQVLISQRIQRAGFSALEPGTTPLQYRYRQEDGGYLAVDNASVDNSVGQDGRPR